MFNDLKVIELASVLAGPSVGQFFAELGATVIKVENTLTGGDITRSWRLAGEQTDDRSAYFCSVNWGKKSVAVDLTIQQGRDVIYALVKDADIVIASYKPGDAEKLGVDYKTLEALNPAIIYGQITGYGSDYSVRVGYDAVIQAECGFMSMNGEPGGPSLKIPVALMDILAAHHLKEGLLLSLIARNHKGKGDFVEVSLIQAAVASLANQASNWLVAHNLPGKQGSAHPNIAPYGDVFKTSDEAEVLLAIGSDRQFQDLCMVVRLNELYKDARFSSNQSRVKNRAMLNELLRVAISHLKADKLMESLHALKIPAGIINNIQQVFETPQAKELLVQVEDLVGVRTFVAQSHCITKKQLLPPPHFGEHTHEILEQVSMK